MSHACHPFWRCYKNPYVLLTFDKVHNPLRLPRETRSECPTVVRTWCVLHILTSKCASPQRRALFRHLSFQKWSEHGVFCTFWLENVLRATTACTFFNITTSKSGPKLVCFVHFDFEMCFAPQRRALFRHLNFQKWSEAGVLCILTWKCASRHSGVQFFISHHLARWLTRRFSEPTFRPSGATHHWKNTVFRDFPTFSRAWIFFLLTPSLRWSSLFFFSSLLWLFPPWIPTSAFHLSILSEFWLLNFLRPSLLQWRQPSHLTCSLLQTVLTVWKYSKYIFPGLKPHFGLSIRIHGEIMRENFGLSWRRAFQPWLVGGFINPSEKWWTSSVGMMTFPYMVHIQSYTIWFIPLHLIIPITWFQPLWKIWVTIPIIFPLPDEKDFLLRSAQIIPAMSIQVASRGASHGAWVPQNAGFRTEISWWNARDIWDMGSSFHGIIMNNGTCHIYIYIYISIYI